MNDELKMALAGLVIAAILVALVLLHVIHGAPH